jgi:hypothetical protein
LTLRSHGPRGAHISGVMCVLMLLFSGCGTFTSNSAGKAPSGSNTPAGTNISTGARMGLIWNPGDSTLRALVGVPGSAQLGPALFPVGAYAAGAFAPVSQTALLIDPKGNLQIMTEPSLLPSTVAQNISPTSVIAFAPRGGYAVVFAPGANSVLVMSGLPQAPALSTVSAAAEVQGAAVSDAGTLLLASGGKSAVAVTSINASGNRSSLVSLGGYGGMSFIAGSEDSLIADSAANTLVRYHTGVASILATHTNGLNQPFAVASSQDGHWAVTADQADGSILRIDLSGVTAPAQSTCACSPTQLSELNGNAVFELTAPAASPGWMIEADGATSRVLFIPPVRGGQ